MMASELSLPLKEKELCETFSLPEALKALEEGKQVDTLELERLAREEQGTFECEVSFRSEADLHKHVLACKKNPGHEKFVPINTLNLDSLPDCYKNQKILDLLHLQADLTVKIKVRYVSNARSTDHPRLGQDFPLSKCGGTNLPRFGTGMVIRVEENKATEISQNESFTVVITTARHVIFDQSEADTAEIECSFYSEDGNKTVKKLESNKIFQSINEDVCSLDLRIHDKSLGSRLFEYSKQFNEKRRNAATLFKKDNKCGALLPIVSHPHGCEKQISFGHIMADEPLTENAHPGFPASPSSLRHDADLHVNSMWHTGVAYDTPTCNGSSGAFIVHYRPGKQDNCSTHEGYNDDNQWNCSGVNRNLHIECNHMPEGCPPLDLHLWRKMLKHMDFGFRLPHLWDTVMQDKKMRAKASTFLAHLAERVPISDKENKETAYLQLAKIIEETLHEKEFEPIGSIAAMYLKSLHENDLKQMADVALEWLGHPSGAKAMAAALSTADSQVCVDDIELD